MKLLKNENLILSLKKYTVQYEKREIYFSIKIIRIESYINHMH